MTILLQDISPSKGRVLDVLTAGVDTAGAPTVLLHHGSPSDATCWLDWDDIATDRGVRIVAMSRPGYAHSTRQQGRTIADAAADAAAVLDHLGVASFVTAGWSGGGPHALACGGLLGGRCTRVATLAGAAPYGVEGLDFIAGMGPENVEEFTAAVAGEPTLRSWLTQHGEPFRHVTGAELADAFGGLVPQIDKDVLQQGYADHMAAETRRALAGGFDGWVDDDLAFTRPWGFDVSAIEVPVTVWQGDLDLMVPRAHGDWLVAQIPTAAYRAPAGHGHISLVTRYRNEILDDLLLV